jgi:hypothetical protein
MKKIMLTVVFSFCLLSLFAQADLASPKSKVIIKDRIMPYQMGKGQTDKDSFTITFDTPVEWEYTIVLTPIGKAATLYVAEQTKEKAVVRSADGSALDFQYIVFTKLPRTQVENPQLQPQQPNK